VYHGTQFGCGKPAKPRKAPRYAGLDTRKGEQSGFHHEVHEAHEESATLQPSIRHMLPVPIHLKELTET
jgi:hypothetical protein